MKLLIFVVVLTTVAVFTRVNTRVRYDYSDRDVLAALINSECDRCSMAELLLVGSTVINRCNHELFPKEISEVIGQRGQYHGASTKRFKPTVKSREAADLLLAGLYITPEILYFCTYSSKQPMDTVLILGQFHKYGK